MSAVSSSPIAIEKLKKWTASQDEWIGRAGWSLLANVAIKDKSLEDEFFLPFLKEIKVHIHTEKIEKRNNE